MTDDIFRIPEMPAPAPTKNDAAASFFADEDRQARGRNAVLLKQLLPGVLDDLLYALLEDLYEQANPHVVYRVLNDEFACLQNMLREPDHLVEVHMKRALRGSMPKN